MIKVTQKQQKEYVKDFDNKYRKEQHIEVYIVTTYWFLFIPIIKQKKLVSSNM